MVVKPSYEGAIPIVPGFGLYMVEVHIAMIMWTDQMNLLFTRVPQVAAVEEERSRAEHNRPVRREVYPIGFNEAMRHKVQELCVGMPDENVVGDS